MKLSIGQYAKHAQHGVGTITDIQTRVFSNETFHFYVFKVDNGEAAVTVHVPTETGRLQPLATREEAEAILSLISKEGKFKVDHQSWNRRYREFMEKVNSNDLALIAEVVTALDDLYYEKELSFGERTLREVSMRRLVDELSVVLGVDRKVMENRVEIALEMRP